MTNHPLQRLKIGKICMEKMKQMLLSQGIQASTIVFLPLQIFSQQFLRLNRLLARLKLANIKS